MNTSKTFFNETLVLKKYETQNNDYKLIKKILKFDNLALQPSPFVWDYFSLFSKICMKPS